MTRRSSLKSAPRAISLDPLSDDSEFVDNEVEVAEKNSRATRGKKRKTYDNKDTKADGEPQAKKVRSVRGKRGLLKQLVEMPVDVLFEIFGGLEPLDLLHLTRTSKDLRALLLTRSSISTWKQSLENVPGLPECPDYLSEPQYAELVFGKCCHICNKSLGAIQTMWGARVRACNRCLETDDRFQETTLGYAYRNYGTELYKLRPMVQVSRKSGRHNRFKYYTDAMLDESWRSEYEKLESSAKQQEWLANKIQEMTVVHRHSVACSAWLANVHTRREADKQTVIENRKAVVIQRLRTLGWGEELDRLDESSPKPENQTIVAKACQKDLTEKVLSSLDEPLIRFMEDIKIQRLQKERRAFLKERLAALNTVRENCVSTLPANAICPPTSELFRLPFVRDIFDSVPATGDFTIDDLKPVSLSFDVLNLQWQKEIELKLLGLIQAVGGPNVQNSLDAAAVLNLATSFFSCGSCNRFLRYPAILIHSCATKYNYRLPEKDDFDQSYIAETRGEAFWNANQYISMKQEHVAVVSRLLDMVGLDSKTATIQEMDNLNPIFECISCNSLSEGRAVMSWQTALDHITKHSSASDIKLVFLGETESEIIRPRIIEQVERSRHQTYYDSMICILCKKVGRRMLLREHIRKDHGKPNPAEEDVVLRIDTDPIPKIYRHWPPREGDDKLTTAK